MLSLLVLSAVSIARHPPAELVTSALGPIWSMALAASVELGVLDRVDSS